MASKFHQEIQDLVSGNGFNAGVFYHQMESDEWDQRRAPTLKAREAYASNLLSLLPNEMAMPVTKKVDIRGSVMMTKSIFERYLQLTSLLESALTTLGTN